MPEEISNEGLGIMIKDLAKTVKDSFNRFEKQNSKEHEEIIIHQKETNGTVKSHSGFINRVKGALLIMNIVGIPIVLHYLFTNILK